LEEECTEQRLMEDNCWADQNSHRIVVSIKTKKFSLLILLLRCSNKTTQVFYMYICISQSMCISSYTSTRYSLRSSHVPLGVSKVVSGGKDNKVWQRPGLTDDEYKYSAGEMNVIFITQRFNCSVTCTIQYSNVCAFTRYF
jgi:hypothetical protein